VFSANSIDLVDSTVPVACKPTSGSTFQNGLTAVECTAHDTAGNATAATFTVRVRDAATQLDALAAAWRA